MSGIALTSADNDYTIRIIHGLSCVMVTPMTDGCLVRYPKRTVVIVDQ
jgi:hypothetical protein